MSDAIHDQKRLIEALCNPQAYPHPVDAVKVIETHISTVLLAGDFAYKFKKPVDLGFVNFVALDDRRHYCEEEMRLNSRLAPSIYLEVVTLRGTPDEPRFDGDGSAIEYAVRMRRFSQDALLDRRIEQGTLSPRVIDEIADRVARFHQQLPVADDDRAFGEPESVLAPMEENFRHLDRIARDPAIRTQLQRIGEWTRSQQQALEPVLAARRSEGFIRECHGDMHLGNMALVDDEVVIFDGIEFNEALRWIDVVSEIAFLTMDLDHRNASTLGWRFLNRYLMHTGDFPGLALLRFYQTYRAMVRAKVDGIRSTQEHLDEQEKRRIIDDCRVLLDLAEGYTRSAKPRLLLTCGLSGSGKTTVAGKLAERVGMVHLRSDVERKRLFGLPADADSGSRVNEQIYTQEASEATYRRLLDVSRELLHAGFSVIIDAAFLRRARRASFLELAESAGVPVKILRLEAPLEVLRTRIAERQAAGTDASEAGLEVLEHQREIFQSPQDPEPILPVSMEDRHSDTLARITDELIDRPKAGRQ